MRLTCSFASDLSSKEGIGQLAKFIIEKEAYLDILISNAGIRRDPPVTVQVPTASLDDLQASLWSSKHSDWDDTFRINCTAHYFLSVALLKLLVQAARRKLPDGRSGSDTGRGVIVITSSCASLHNSTNIDLTSYATSKAGLDHLVALLATKFAPWYVRVNSINPGFVPSKMNPVGEGRNQFADLFAKMPAKRIGRMEDIAGTVLWLCSQAGSYVDGRSICVDGGRVLLANGQ
jgi:NAD(P)-dependent dehydrogenase (short-subunit alcohol dehydrogenase family)